MKTVVCTFCNSEIYTYDGPEPNIEMKAVNFKPKSGVPAPKSGEPLACPVCRTKFTGFSLQNKQLRMMVSSAYYGSGNIGSL